MIRRKTILFLYFFLSVLSAFSYNKNDQLQYSIVFGSCFENETISLRINGVNIFHNHLLLKNKKDRKGNLSLSQTDKGIRIYANGSEMSKSKIKYDFILNLDIAVNGKWKQYKVDLRKGKVVLIDFCTEPANTANKNISIEQIQEPVLLM